MLVVLVILCMPRVLAIRHCFIVNKRIQVALLTTSFPLKAGGVSGIFVQRLVSSLPLSIDATVITPCDTMPTTIQPGKSYRIHYFRYAPWRWQRLAHQPGGIPVALNKSLAMRLLLPFLLLAMLWACYRTASRADVIHANWTVNGVLAGMVGWLLNKPVITTLRGEDVTRAATSRLYRRLMLWCLQSNYKLVGVSKAICDLIVHDYPDFQHKVTFLPNGVDTGLLRQEISCKRDKHSSFEMVTIGSLIARKGVDVIIDAISLTKIDALRLSVIGDGDELDKLKALVLQHALSERVRFLGEIAPTEISKIFSGADALILASYSEGRPNVVLEAFAAGVPVIASDIDGVREILFDEETGLSFPAGDASVLANKIEQLHNDKKLQSRLSENGRDFIIKNRLIWEEVGKRYAALYKEAIENQH